MTLAAYVPFVDFAHGGGDYVWPMLVSAFCNLGGFVQVGQAEFWTGSDVVFYEVNNCGDGGANQQWYHGSPENQAHQFTVNMGAGVGNYALIVDNTTINAGTVNFTSDAAQYSGETHAIDDQMFGGRNNLYSFSALLECRWTGSYTCLNPVNRYGHSVRDETFFGYTTVSGTIKINDQACAT